MSENFPGSMAETPKPDVPQFETLADALPEEDREKFARLSEQVEDIAQSHGGRIVDAELTSTQRLLVDELDELKSRAFGEIRMAK
jgi:hypothetical protein